MSTPSLFAMAGHTIGPIVVSFGYGPPTHPGALCVHVNELPAPTVALSCLDGGGSVALVTAAGATCELACVDGPTVDLDITNAGGSCSITMEEC